MTIDPDRINRLRARVIWTMRGVATLALFAGTYLVLKRLFFAAGVGSLEMALQSWTDVGESHSFYRGLALVAAGAALGVFARPLARWVIALPPDECPRCGHARAPGGRSAGGQCPECGLPERGS